MPARSLTEFPDEVCHLMDFLEQDEKGWECVDLLKIDLSHNDIPEIPSQIGTLKSVISFKICQNKISAIPQELFSLNLLAYLDLSNNCLVGEISPNLGQLQALKELVLSSNKLSALPESLGQLSVLEVLRIEDNQLTRLPESIGALQKLQIMTAQSNQLEILPDSFSNLRFITTLDLSKNRLTSLRGCLKHNESLKFLDLRQNRLVVFPELPFECVLDTLFLGFNQLNTINEASLLRAQNHLTILDLRDNKLTALSEKVCLLHQLKTLDLTNNDLSDLPPGLGYLPKLNHILTDGNSMRSIRRTVLSGGSEPLKKYLRTRGAPPPGVNSLEAEPDEFEATPSGSTDLSYLLRDATASGNLDLSEKRLSTLPPEILTNSSLVTKLTVLDLSKNGLTSLPSGISECTNVQTIVFDDNSLENLPQSLSRLPYVQILRLRKNNFTSEALENILHHNSPLVRSVKELDVRNNVLQSVPQNIEHLKLMHTLLLSFNRISNLDNVNWGRMSQLSILSVADNKLISIGNVYQIPNLTSLSIENNNLSQIPFSLGLCQNLKALYLNGNPQRTIRITTLNKGTEEIVQYLKNRLTPDEVESLLQAKQNSHIEIPEPSTEDATIAPPPSPLPPAVATSSTAQASVISENTSAILPQLEERISQLEAELEESGLSVAKRYALKKELAKVRAEKIRESRKAK
ncbi:unnamed protein product [Aphanomyces euteiches]